MVISNVVNIGTTDTTISVVQPGEKILIVLQGILPLTLQGA